MSEFNFKSQICTDKNQSERLLSLGLKPETADCALFLNGNNEFEQLSKFGNWEKYADMLPAWSLHRLIEMMPNGLEMQDEEGETWEYLFHLSHVEVVYDVYLYERRFSEMANIYDNLISCIEWLIKEGYFPKEYLV